LIRLVWSTQAQRELLDIADHYDAIDPTLANEIVERVETAVSPLLDFPRLGAIVDRLGARKWCVPHTPFILLYDVAGDRIEVLSVSHERSDWANP
jgi:toxin ParE1/3/4